MGRLRRWRKMTWVVWIWCLLIVVWAVAGTAGNDCASEVDRLSQDACATGTGIGVAIVLLIGFFGFMFLGFIWFMTRPKTRTCPRCGEDVRKGQVTCPSCAHPMGQPA